jgi:hypothetical protein
MNLGHSAGIAAALALEKNIDVQDVPYAELLPLLIDSGQIVSLADHISPPSVIF